MALNLGNNKQLILFDGVCNLCDASVQYIVKHDQHDMFRYTALQSDVGKEIIETFNIDTAKMDSILLYSVEKGIYYKSTAALKIASQLGFPRNLMAIFLIVPPFIRNWVYDYIAKNRYEWYGKKEECMIPTAELKSKFL
ncbi:putative DCC family thiol-disulfide oxidoreductase YuxK [Gelidibacter algens]|jgi:predicted DCC family thiol-disulfide oxidoreductase YuxK|uniref:Putative DCC family thiol-disulfide oxidoreductase YuxK n=1 Tax=Gelidibacter algens TaxID=49280 RepID=A0A1A7R4U9_9FLAO|nr:DCC1-like thiol-disulfide oxidoreductase family protein [Gelidibacter algens]OBX26528.1 thiol-disulfide oxidoreductase [Gelidibacter algens]RAJ26645.1 putative DCC family thiol-disulfide oxidoreductase YuxK [Gelidibacter algens]